MGKGIDDDNVDEDDGREVERSPNNFMGTEYVSKCKKLMLDITHE